MVDDYDAVGAAHRGEAVRDQDGRGLVQNQVQCLLDLPFCSGSTLAVASSR